MEGGFTANAGNKILGKGFCTEKQLPSSNFHFADNKSSFQQELQAMEKLYSEYNKRVQHVTGGVFGPTVTKDKGSLLLTKQNKFKSELMCGQINSEYQELFPNVSINELMKILDGAGSNNDFIDKLVAKSCKPRYKPKTDISLDSIELGLWNDKTDLMNKIDSRLNSGDILGINYKSTILSDAYEYNGGNHASSVVARKFDPSSGSCKYLVRNSWGTGCGSYDKKYKCENGNVWVPEEYLKRSLYGVVYAE